MKYIVKIKGITPYMQHRMDDKKLEEWEKNRGHIIERQGLNQEDFKIALFHSYVDANDQFYIPAEHFRAALINGGTFVKAKVGTRSKSMKSIVAAMFMITPLQIKIPPFDTIDIRSAVNKNVKARVMVKRPQWTDWEVEFTLSTGQHTFTIQELKELITTTGNYVGIGSYRPLNNGYFGRFELVSLDPVSE